MNSALAAHPPTKRWTLGGPAATADPTAASFVGNDRYDTCAKVAAAFFTSPNAAGVASGEVGQRGARVVGMHRFLTSAIGLVGHSRVPARRSQV